MADSDLLPNAIGTHELGPSFRGDFAAAGFEGLWLTWGADGQHTWRDGVTDQQRTAVAAFVLTHDPRLPEAPLVISDRQFAQQAAVAGLITDDEAEAWVSAGTIPPELLTLVGQLPAAAQFGARMMLKGATTYNRLDPMTVQLTTAFGWDAKTRNAFWVAASKL